MTRDFRLHVETFQEIQRVSVDKCRDFVVRAQAMARDNAKRSPKDKEQRQSRESLLSANDESEDSPLMEAQEQKIAGLEDEISYNQALIQERELGIQEIETAMAEVHEIFCDLGLLVGEQQGLIGTGLLRALTPE